MAKKPVHVVCQRCSGKGRLSNIARTRCVHCIGKGWVYGWFSRERACPKCEGEGFRILNIGDTCHFCGGRGYEIQMQDERAGGSRATDVSVVFPLASRAPARVVVAAGSKPCQPLPRP